MTELKNINLIGPCPLADEYINKDFYTIFIDGGLNHNLKISSSLSIGDGDSSSTPLQTLLPQQKNRSDLYYALKKVPEETKTIYCHGLLGGRLDHQIMLFGDIVHFLKNSHATFHFYPQDHPEKALSIFPPGKHQILHKGLFSLFSFQDQKISLNGEVDYKLGPEYTEFLSGHSSHGLSNISQGKIELHNTKPLIIFFPNA